MVLKCIESEQTTSDILPFGALCEGLRYFKKIYKILLNLKYLFVAKFLEKRDFLQDSIEVFKQIYDTVSNENGTKAL